MFFIHAFNSHKKHYNNCIFLYPGDKKDIVFLCIENHISLTTLKNRITLTPNKAKEMFTVSLAYGIGWVKVTPK
jgi:hypothetical protein